MPASADGRPLVVVLQSRQPLTVDPADAFPRDGFEVVVLTDGDPGAVLREDVKVAAEPHVVRRERAEWASQVAGWRAGGPVEIVANDEYCLQDCAALRAEAGLPRRHPTGLDGYLDKVVMKRRLQAHGVRVPRFHAFEPVVPASSRDLRHALDEVGLPAVVKPRQEANSRGVRVLETGAELQSWLVEHEGQAGWQLDEYVEGTPLHVNALVRHGRLAPVQVGEYAGPLLGVDVGRALGGWTIPSTDGRCAPAHDLNRRVVEALGGDGDFVVHTELVVDRRGDPVVLEVAARAPGALVSEMARLHAGLHLEVANLRLQAGLPVPEPSPTGVEAGWLWLPVMPGERFRGSDGLPAASLDSRHRLHVRAVARDGNGGATGAIGASLLLWSTDPVLLAKDLRTASHTVWFT